MKMFLTAGLSCLGLFLLSAGAYQQTAPADDPAEREPMLAHNVYFSLNDNSQAAKKEIVDDCHKYLSPIPGMVFYAAGTVSDVQRSVVDRQYDVALHVVFKNRAAMQEYLVAPKHLEFVAKHKPNWKQVRVFDSLVTGPPK